jgi:hypothetical protein
MGRRFDERLLTLWQQAGPGVVQAALTNLLTHAGLGAVAPEAGIVGGTLVRQLLTPPMAAAEPDRPVQLPAPLAYTAPVDDPRCTPGWILWFPAVSAGALPTVDPATVGAVLPVWLPDADHARRYAAAVLGCPLSGTPDPAAAAAAVAAWTALPAADRAAPVFLPDTPWLVTALGPDGPWLPWRLFSVGGVPRAAVLPDPTRPGDVWHPFTAAPRTAPTAAAATALLHDTGAAGPRDPILVYPATALAPYFTVAGDPPAVTRRPAPGPVPSRQGWPWPDHAPDAPRRADGTAVWHVATLRPHGAVVWTVDALRQIRLGGDDPDHPWRFATPAAALAALRRAGCFGAYQVPPLAPEALLRAYPALHAPAPAASPRRLTGFLPPPGA